MDTMYLSFQYTILSLILVFTMLNPSTFAERYFLYDIDSVEGFNLKRDVYIRVVNLIRAMSEKTNQTWTVVLPPWGPTRHWDIDGKGAQFGRLPWGTFFDIESLKTILPVIEFDEFYENVLWPPSEMEQIPIDIAIHLKHNFEFSETERDERPKLCPKSWYESAPDNMHDVDFRWNSSNDTHLIPTHGSAMLVGKRYECIVGALEIAHLASFLPELLNSSTRYVYLHSAEKLVHGTYDKWSPEFWQVRRSMRFSETLKLYARKFLQSRLNYIVPTNMTENKTDHLTGRFIAIHWRCGDYVLANHRDPWINTPTPTLLVEQIRQAVAYVNANLSDPLDTVFLATDGLVDHVRQVQDGIKPLKLVRFVPTERLWEKIGPGGVAIVDQLICSHARFFIGTYQSTFSFRIKEERMLMNLSVGSTFNDLCAKGQVQLYDDPGTASFNCTRPTAWPVVL